MVALDADTGKLRWYHQEVPDDVWDFDSAYECVLIDRAINGRMRKLLVHMNKSGVTFVLDRVTGEFIGAFSMPEAADLDFGHHRRRQAGGPQRARGGQSGDDVSERRGREELELDGVFAAHRLSLRADQ